MGLELGLELGIFIGFGGGGKITDDCCLWRRGGEVGDTDFIDENEGAFLMCSASDCWDSFDWLGLRFELGLGFRLGFGERIAETIRWNV